MAPGCADRVTGPFAAAIVTGNVPAAPPVVAASEPDGVVADAVVAGAATVVPASPSPELPHEASTGAASTAAASTSVGAKPGGFDRMGHPPSTAEDEESPLGAGTGAARTTLPPRVQFGGAGKATGLVPRAGASPLRDSAGIAPDFATTAPLGPGPERRRP